jgi:DNA-binding MarR family transcriptional regulator
MDIYKELFLMQQTYATLFSLANKIQVKGDKSLELLTSRQHMAMVAIAHLPEDETTLNNIARKLGTTKQSVKQKGYVDVVPSSKDKRAVNVKITKAGKVALLVVSEKGIFFLEELFKKFSTEELEIMWKLLKKLYSFDGEEHDGFEEEGNIKMDDDHNELLLRVIRELESRRVQAIDNMRKNI